MHKNINPKNKIPNNEKKVRFQFENKIEICVKTKQIPEKSNPNVPDNGKYHMDTASIPSGGQTAPIQMRGSMAI